MKIVFMGTPEFACPALEALFASRHQVTAVVTSPDKPAGRGRKLTACRAKLTAERLALPIFQPQSLRDGNFHSQMASLGVDLFVIIAFRILPRNLYTIPPRGAINIHASLLPRYRGAAPIQHALLNGEAETGLTSFFLTDQVDQGNIIHQVSTAIGPEENYTSLSQRLACMAGPFLLETLDLIEQPAFRPRKQDDTLATPAPKIGPDDPLIDWEKDSRRIANQVRAFSEHPGAFTYLGGKLIKIIRVQSTGDDNPPELDPGRLQAKDRCLYVGTGDRPLSVLSLQPEGKKIMDTQAFLNGWRIGNDDRFDRRRKGVNTI